MLAVVVAAAVAMTTALVVVLTGDGSEPAADDRRGGGASETGDPDEPDPTEDEPEEPEFQDWLEPTSTLRVAEFRFVSPCQALTLDDVEEIYGGLPATSNVSEETFDVSQRNTGPNSGTSFRPRCDYDQVVRLETEQYTSLSFMRVFGISGAIYADDSAGEITAKLRRYQQAASLTDDESVRTFIEEVIRAGRAYAEFDRTSNRRVFRDFTFEDIVAPVGGAFDMGFVHDNVVYRLGPEHLGGEELAAMSDEEVLEGLEAAAAGVARVREHVTDPALSQSPAPTFAHDDVTFGETTLLEPCAVLTQAVFREITGRRANGPLYRFHPSPDMDAPGGSGSEISVYHNCERASEIERDDLSSDDVTVDFDIRYAPSAAALNEGLRLEEFRPLQRGETQLRTAADWAAELRDGDLLYYKFTVGNYFLGISLTDLQSEGGLGGDITQGRGDRAAHIRAINALVRALERHLAAVEAPARPARARPRPRRSGRAPCGRRRGGRRAAPTPPRRRPRRRARRRGR